MYPLLPSYSVYPPLLSFSLLFTSLLSFPSPLSFLPPLFSLHIESLVLSLTPLFLLHLLSSLSDPRALSLHSSFSALLHSNPPFALDKVCLFSLVCLSPQFLLCPLVSIFPLPLYFLIISPSSMSPPFSSSASLCPLPLLSPFLSFSLSSLPFSLFSLSLPSTHYLSLGRLF